MVTFPEDASFHAGILHTGTIFDGDDCRRQPRPAQQQAPQSNGSRQYVRPSMTVRRLEPLDPTTSCLEPVNHHQQHHHHHAPLPSVGGSSSRSGIFLVKERAMAPVTSSQSGASLIADLGHWMAASFSVGLFVRAARIYMTNALGERTMRPQVSDSATNNNAAISLMEGCGRRAGGLMMRIASMPLPGMDAYKPIYGQSLGTDWPQEISLRRSRSTLFSAGGGRGRGRNSSSTETGGAGSGAAHLTRNSPLRPSKRKKKRKSSSNSPPPPSSSSSSHPQSPNKRSKKR